MKFLSCHFSGFLWAYKIDWFVSNQLALKNISSSIYYNKWMTKAIEQHVTTIWYMITIYHKRGCFRPTYTCKKRPCKFYLYIQLRKYGKMIMMEVAKFNLKFIFFYFMIYIKIGIIQIACGDINADFQVAIGFENLRHYE